MREPGARLGPYRILAPIGRGGMGVVHRAVDERSGREVALKLLAAELARDEGLIRRFDREARAAATVSHPNVVALLDAGVIDGQRYLALELVTGGSLQRRIAREGPLPWREAVRIAIGLARGLAAVHAAGIVHRDVKPDNVLLAADGTAKLGDFGLVRRTHGAGLSVGGTLTKAGDFLGTPAWVAPEQANEASDVDARSDLYAVGGTLFTALTSLPPFDGDGVALLKRVLTQPPRAPSELVPGIPRAVDALVLRLLSKDPAARSASAADLARELEALLASGGGSASRLRAIALALGFAALVAGGVAIGAHLKGRPAPATPPPPFPGAGPQPKAPPKATETAAPLPAWAKPIETSKLLRLTSASEVDPWRTGEPVTWAAWISDDGKVASVGFEGDAILWSPEGRILRRIPLGQKLFSGVLLRDRRRAVVVMRQGKAALVDLVAATGLGFEGNGPTADVRASAVSPDERIAASGAEDGTVCLWNVETGALLRKISHGERTWAIAFVQSGRLLAVGDRAGNLVFYDVASGQKRLAAKVGAAIESMAVAPDEKTMLIGDAAAVATLVDLAPGPNLRTRLVGHGTEGGEYRVGVFSCAFSRDGRLVATGGRDGLVKLWNAQTGELVRTIEGHADTIRSIEFSPDGKRILTAGHDGRIGELAVAADERARGLPPARASEVEIAGRTAVLRHDDGRASFVDLATGRRRPAFAGERVAAIAGSPALATPLVARGPEAREVALWDVEKDRATEVLAREVPAKVRALALSAGGERAAWALDDGRVALWSVKARRAAGEHVPLHVKTFALAFDPLGQELASAGEWGGASMWTFSPPHAASLKEFSLGAGDAKKTWTFAWVAAGPRTGAILARTRERDLMRFDARAPNAPIAWQRADVQAAAVLPERALVAAGVRARLVLLDLETNAEVGFLDLAPLGDYPAALAFAGSRELVVATGRGSILRFELARE